MLSSRSHYNSNEFEDINRFPSKPNQANLCVAVPNQGTLEDDRSIEIQRRE